MSRAMAVMIVSTLSVGACGPSVGSTTPQGTARGLDLALPDLSGALVTPTAERGDEVFVLAFWATWCQPCQQELSKMDALLHEKAARGLRVFAVNVDGPDTAAQVVPWVRREGYRFPVLMDRETRVLTRYNPRGDIPYYVVLAADGRILEDHQGYMSGDVEELAAFLDTVLPAG